MFPQVFARFAQRHPLTLMTRMTLEHVFGAPGLDAMFARTATRQRTEALLFSAVVDLMTVVVHGIRPSIHDAYQAVAETLPVSLTSVYNKLNGVEPGVSAGVVDHVATRAGAVIDALGQAAPSVLPGFDLRILDGNHLPATERRLAVLRGVSAGPRPGFGLVVLDPQRRLPLRVVPVEDAYTQERAVVPQVADLVVPGTCWVGDRNFCTAPHCAAIHRRKSRFLFRQHANLPLDLVGDRRFVGRVETGRIYVQRAAIRTAADRRLRVRRVTLVLDTPTRDGETEIHVVTNLRLREATPRQIVEAYRTRWTIEGAFLEMAMVLEAEIQPLGYPRAALLGLCIGLASYAVLATLRAALAAEHGTARVAAEVSSYHLATEIRAGWEGLDVMTEPGDWVGYRTMTSAAFAVALRAIAARANLRRYRKHPRGPKKPADPRTKFRRRRHISTQRMLEGTPQHAS